MLRQPLGNLRTSPRRCSLPLLAGCSARPGSRGRPERRDGSSSPAGSSSSSTPSASRRSRSISSPPRHGWPPTPRRGSARRSRSGLKKRGVLVKKSARLEVNGEYREVEDPLDRKTVVRIIGRIVDQDSGRPRERVRGEGRQPHVDRRPGRRHDGGPADPRARRTASVRSARASGSRPPTSPRRGSRPVPRAPSRSRSWSAPPVATRSSGPARPRSTKARPT